MHIVVPIGQTVVIRRGPQVPCLIEEDFVFVGEQGPYPDSELPLLEKHGSLYILLDHTTRVVGPRIHEMQELLQIRKDLDSPPLVGIRRLHQPTVIDTVLQWDPFLGRIPLGDIPVPMDKLLLLRIVHPRGKEERCGCCIESRISSRPYK